MISTPVKQVYQNSQTAPVTNGQIVQSTTDYGRFRVDPKNRPIDRNHLERLYEAIYKKNLLREYPIVVSEDMTVIDGQHRLRAAEMLLVPIYYIVSPAATIDDVAETNAHTKRWTKEEFLHHFCAADYREYQNLWQFWQQHNFLSLSLCVRLCHIGDDSSGEAIRESFSRGRYKANDIHFAKRVAAACLEFAEYVSFYKDARFVTALSNLLSNAEYNHSRMMMKMKYLSKKLVPCTDTETYIAVFDEIYNYKVKAGSVVTLRKLPPNHRNYRADRKRQVGVSENIA